MSILETSNELVETIVVEEIEYHLFQHGGRDARRVAWQLGPDYFIVVKLFDGPQIQTLKFWHTAVSIAETAEHWSMTAGVGTEKEALSLVQKAVTTYNSFLDTVKAFQKQIITM